MDSFIDEYLRNPANAVAMARESAGRKSWNIDDDQIYKELASPEFRLYEEITTTPLSASPSLSPISASA